MKFSRCEPSVKKETTRRSSLLMLTLLKPAPTWRFYSTNRATPIIFHTRARGNSYFPIIGDLKPEGEEFRCAVFLDENPSVRFWLRNVDRKPNALWLQLPGSRFYPDFVAMLTDGRTLVVEYKGKHLAEDAREKRVIGELWADASGGQCIFEMPTGNDFSAIDRKVAASK
jgi:hypothetical protein